MQNFCLHVISKSRFVFVQRTFGTGGAHLVSAVFLSRVGRHVLFDDGASDHTAENMSMRAVQSQHLFPLGFSGGRALFGRFGCGFGTELEGTSATSHLPFRFGAGHLGRTVPNAFGSNYQMVVCIVSSFVASGGPVGPPYLDPTSDFYFALIDGVVQAAGVAFYGAFLLVIRGGVVVLVGGHNRLHTFVGGGLVTDPGLGASLLGRAFRRERVLQRMLGVPRRTRPTLSVAYGSLVYVRLFWYFEGTGSVLLSYEFFGRFVVGGGGCTCVARNARWVPCAFRTKQRPTLVLLFWGGLCCHSSMCLFLPLVCKRCQGRQLDCFQHIVFSLAFCACII